MPTRIQRCRTPGWRMPDNTRYVGRPTKWGNPFQVQQVTKNHWTIVDENDRSAALREEPPRIPTKYLAHFTATNLFDLHTGPMGLYQADFSDVDVLAGYNLACWCPDNLPCHADVLLARANGWPTPRQQEQDE